MVLTVQYTPKTGINAGKQCFPMTCGNMLLEDGVAFTQMRA